MSEYSDFVRVTCAGRDESHGYSHMHNVAEMSSFILMQDYPNDANRLRKLVLAVAWLHDVADHKYDTEGDLSRQVEEFLISRWGHEMSKKIMKAIALVSFSKEEKMMRKGTPIDYEKELGADLCVVRHIVSDADKLEALGQIGLDRCIEYTRHILGKDANECDVIANVCAHAREKLLRLKTEFIRTPTGKVRAGILHDELVLGLNARVLS